MINIEDAKLDNRDMYFLGLLRGQATELGAREDKLPRECSEIRALAI